MFLIALSLSLGFISAPFSSRFETNRREKYGICASRALALLETGIFAGFSEESFYMARASLSHDRVKSLFLVISP